jgi:type II secretion system protein H
MKSSLSHLQSLTSSPAGFSLLELLVVVAIMGILGSLASLWLVPLLSLARLDNGARQIATDLQLVRMKAIAQNRSLRVTFRPSSHDYIVERDEGGSWEQLLLHSHIAEPVQDTVIELPPGVGIASVNSSGDVIFVPRGHIDAGITIALGSNDGAGTKRVIVNLAGRVRIE